MGEITLVAVMTGALMLTADLVRALPHMIRIQLIDISSYGSGVTAGEVRFNTDLAAAGVAGRDVLVVDDVLDTGRTLGALVARLRRAGAASVRTCVLVSKPAGLRGEPDRGASSAFDSAGAGLLTGREGREVLVGADYVGFEIPDEFVVGYGMDYDDKYRNLPDICILKRAGGG